MNYVCEKCTEHGLRFSRSYRPDEFLEGCTSSKVWIIGLNPKKETDYPDSRTSNELAEYFAGKIHPYFKDFKRVSERLFSKLGKDHGVAHTDLVKCFSLSWPPHKKCGIKERRQIIENCWPFLRMQMERYLPDILICNGADTCKAIGEFIRPKEDHQTYYFSSFNGKKIGVVLSGFIGRIDNYSKRRLGKEIEQLMDRFNI